MLSKYDIEKKKSEPHIYVSIESKLTWRVESRDNFVALIIHHACAGKYDNVQMSLTPSGTRR